MEAEPDKTRRRRQLLIQLSAGCAAASLFLISDLRVWFCIGLALLVTVCVALAFASGAITWLGLKGLLVRRRPR